MIGKVTRGADFAGLARYLMHAGGRDRVAWTKTRNLLSEDRTEIVREMRVVESLQEAGIPREFCLLQRRIDRRVRRWRRHARPC